MGWSNGSGWNAKQGWSRAAVGGGGAAFTWDPATLGAQGNLANGNRDFIQATGSGGGNWTSVRANASQSTGLDYVEFLIVSITSGTPNAGIGFGDATMSSNTYLGSGNSAGSLFAFPGSTFNAGIVANGTAIPSSDTVSAGDVYMLAKNQNTGKAWLGKNGSWFSGMDSVAGTGPWVTWTPSGSGPWFVAATQNSNSGCTIRLPSTATYASAAPAFPF